MSKKPTALSVGMQSISFNEKLGWSRPMKSESSLLAKDCKSGGQATTGGNSCNDLGYQLVREKERSVGG